MKHVNKSEHFTSVYDNFFPKSKSTDKNQQSSRFWITKGIATSSKRKQKFLEKYLKRRTKDTETYLKV